jgi:hypothetical protein
MKLYFKPPFSFVMLLHLDETLFQAPQKTNKVLRESQHKMYC